MDESQTVARNIALQREWYGEPLGDRVRRLVVVFDISQAQLAEVLGISPPMLSQVMSGRRAKIGNPAVLARLIMLERAVSRPAVAEGERDAQRQALDEVRDSRPAVTTDAISVEGGGAEVGGEEQVAFAVLRAVASSTELTEAAGRLDGTHTGLSRLLLRAAGAELDQD
ncbi:helix-turn-helix domain-containing protein [Sciscionella marina]|uniref:helix-turn-helix domain-containing protein n=1 Tax=Sciscionella marina TaxID=508770 RepID=UPI00035DC1F4|nr:helix-turn-helix transcriptional regulator [Sciscionella marina]